MIRFVLALAALLLLASCPLRDDRADDARAPDLETAAMLRGLVRAPGESDVVGLYARDTDRLCVVRRASGGAYQIGAYVDYGDGIGCSGAGTLTRSGDRVSIALTPGCTFEAGFDGDRIAFPARLPAACAQLCRGRASFAALTALRLSEVPAEAATMRDARGRLPCAE